MNTNSQDDFKWDSIDIKEDNSTSKMHTIGVVLSVS